MIRRMMAILGVLLLAIQAVAGTWTPNSFIYKPSTGARGEGEKRTFDSGMDRVDARLGKEIWVGDPVYGATLPAAVSAIGGNQALLRIPAGIWSISASLTIPANVTLKPERGAIFSIANGVTLTVNGGFEAGPYQCLSRTGTGQVSFGAGSVQEVKVVWFGTNTDAITHALSAVPSGASLRFNAGYSYSFSPSSTVTITGKSISLVCDPGVVIDATASTASPVLKLTGSVCTYYALGADITMGATSFTANAALAASLSEGDLVIFTTNNSVGGAGDLWIPNGSTTFWKGEICEVLSVSGTTVTVKNIIRDSYTASHTVATKMSAISGGLYNFSMKGTVTNHQIGVSVYYSRNYEVKNSELKGFGYTCLGFYYGYNVLVDHLSASNFSGGVGTDYGLMFASCQTARVTNSNIAGGRYAVTTGGWEPNRFTTIGPGNTLENNNKSSTLAVGMHENNEYTLICGNHINGGILWCGRNGEISGNVITIDYTGYTGVQLYLNNSTDYARIIDNQIYAPQAVGASGTSGISFDLLNGSTIRSLEVVGNTINGYCVGINVDLAGTTAGSRINLLNITDNKTDLLQTSGGYYLKLSGYDVSHLLNIDTINVINNKFRYVSTTGALSQNASITDMVFNDNTLFYDGAVAGTGPVVFTTANGTAITRIDIRRNRTINTTAMGQFWINAGVVYLAFTDNTLNNFNSYGGALLYATDTLFRDNRQVKCLGNLSLHGKYYSRIFGQGNVESWGTAAPTTGAWLQGDIIKNTSAAAGGASGWVCTTTGTFGGANDNTGSTDGSTGTITNMTNASAFNVGDWVNASAGFSTTGPFKILSKTATSVTVNANSNSVQNNVTTSTSNPIFKPMANLGS